MDKYSLAALFGGIGLSLGGLFCIIRSAADKNDCLMHFGASVPEQLSLAIRYLSDSGIFLLSCGALLVLFVILIEWIYGRKQK